MKCETTSIELDYSVPRAEGGVTPSILDAKFFQRAALLLELYDIRFWLINLKIFVKAPSSFFFENFACGAEKF